jgi:transposase
VTKEIWRAAEREVRDRLATQAPGLTKEEAQAILDRLPSYLDAALRECLGELAKQEIDRRDTSEGQYASKIRSTS